MITFGAADEQGFINSNLEADDKPQERRRGQAKFSFVGRR